MSQLLRGDTVILRILEDEVGADHVIKIYALIRVSMGSGGGCGVITEGFLDAYALL